jgi:hypothetical protein
MSVSVPLRRALQYALPSALMASLGTSLLVPLQLDMPAMDFLIALGVALLDWVGVFTVMATGILAVEARLDRWWKTAAATLGLAVLGVISMMWTKSVHVPFDIPTLARHAGGQSWDLAVFWLWQGVVYGVPFMLACMLAVRGQRSQRTLAQAGVARSQAEAQLDQARMDTLRRQVDPQFLLEAMSAIQSRYDHDPAGADALLDRLVGFLREAMPGVRSGEATLAAEVALVRAYAAIRVAMGSGSVLQVEAGESVPDVPFPAMVLLPLLASLAGNRFAHLRVRNDPGQLAMVLGGPPGVAVAGSLETMLYRTQVALQAMYGDSFSLQALPGTGSRGAEVTLVLGRATATPHTQHRSPSSFAPADTRRQAAQRSSPRPRTIALPEEASP